MLFLKRYLPLVICGFTGVVFGIQYYVPHRASEDFLTFINDWMIVIFGFSMILALASLFHVHYQKIRRRQAGWGFSLIVFITIVVTVIIGIISQGETVDEKGLTSFGWIYTNMLVPLSGTMFSILAFFIASAAFRAFRARTLDAFLLLLAAIIIMFGRVPVGEYLWSKIWGEEFSLQIGHITEWIMGVLNMAARRGILLGVALGAIATSLKIIFGIERAYLGGRE